MTDELHCITDRSHPAEVKAFTDGMHALKALWCPTCETAKILTGDVLRELDLNIWKPVRAFGTPSPQHCDLPDAFTFECAWCFREVSWDFGAADQHYALCDDCWAQANEFRVTSVPDVCQVDLPPLIALQPKPPPLQPASFRGVPFQIEQSPDDTKLFDVVFKPEAIQLPRSEFDAVQRSIDRRFFGETTAAEPAFKAPDLNEMLAAVAMLEKSPRLESIVVHPDHRDELLTMFKEHGADFVGTPIIESNTLGLRWLMTWSDAHRFRALDGGVYSMPKPPEATLQPLPPIGAFIKDFEDEPFFKPRFMAQLLNRTIYFSIDPAAAHEIVEVHISRRSKRASKGWRKHVRRQKAAERLAARGGARLLTGAAR